MRTDRPPRGRATRRPLRSALARLVVCAAAALPAAGAGGEEARKEAVPSAAMAEADAAYRRGDDRGAFELVKAEAERRARVRGLQSHGKDVDEVAQGQRAAVNLIGVHHSEIIRGHELASPDYLKPSKLLSATISVLSDSPRPIRHRSMWGANAWVTGCCG